MLLILFGMSLLNLHILSIQIVLHSTMTEWNSIWGALLFLVAAVHAQDAPPHVAMVDVGGEMAVDSIRQTGDDRMNEIEVEPALRDEEDRHGHGRLILTSVECFCHSLCYLRLMWYHSNKASFMYTASGGACNGLHFKEKCEESATICEAVFETKGTTCGTHCQSVGLVCEEAWDEASHTCASKLTTDGRRVGNGCGMSYGDQICRCATRKGK